MAHKFPGIDMEPRDPKKTFPLRVLVTEAFIAAISPGPQNHRKENAFPSTRGTGERLQNRSGFSRL